ncbi:MAG: hypothetical protein ACTSRS_17850 [Candidatus Helarchaeota archaeon]
MPLTSVVIEMSNGMFEILYYPSNVVKDFFREKEQYKFTQFIQLALNSLEESNKRVLAKYGYPCIGCAILKNKLVKWKTKYDNELVTIVKIEEFQ